MLKSSKTLAAAAALAATTALLLGGCAVTSDPTPTPTAGPTGEPGTESPAPAFGGEQGEVPAQEDIPDNPDLREIVLLTGCDAADGGWAATGTAENPGADAVTYQVVVIFTDAQSRGVTSSTIEVPVDAGATVDWTAGAEFAPPEGTQCVLAGVADTADIPS